MTKYVNKEQNTARYIAAVSGLFITTDNPNGLTKKEMIMITVLIKQMELLNVNVITQSVRERTMEILQVDSRYLYNMISNLRRKRVITKDDTMHPFLRRGVIIEMGYAKKV
jgi:hypothetical protein